MYANSPHSQGLMAAPAGFNRSFSDMNGYQQHAMEKPQIYTVCTTTTAFAQSHQVADNLGCLLGRLCLRNGSQSGRCYAPTL